MNHHRKSHSMKYLSVLILIFLTLPSSAQAEDDVEITQIKDNLHMLVSPMGGNVAISSGEDGIFIIDDQLTERSKIIDNAIKTIRNKDVKFILNTHYHFDHTGGNEYFGNKDAVIVAHDNVRNRLSTKQFITYFKREMPPMPKAGLPVVTFTNDMTFHFNNDDIRVIHLPTAHTDGDSAAYFTKENVIVAGDTIFNNMYPFIDDEHGGSIKGILAAHDVLLNLANDQTVIVPGHGALMSKSDLVAYRQILQSITDNIESAIKEGKTLEQIIAMQPTKEFDKIVDKGIIPSKDFVTLIYKELSR